MPERTPATFAAVYLHLPLPPRPHARPKNIIATVHTATGSAVVSSSVHVRLLFIYYTFLLLYRIFFSIYTYSCFSPSPLENNTFVSCFSVTIGVPFFFFLFFFLYSPVFFFFFLIKQSNDGASCGGYVRVIRAYRYLSVMWDISWYNACLIETKNKRSKSCEYCVNVYGIRVGHIIWCARYRRERRSPSTWFCVSSFVL